MLTAKTKQTIGGCVLVAGLLSLGGTLHHAFNKAKPELEPGICSRLLGAKSQQSLSAIVNELTVNEIKKNPGANASLFDPTASIVAMSETPAARTVGLQLDVCKVRLGF